MRAGPRRPPATPPVWSRLRLLALAAALVGLSALVVIALSVSGGRATRSPRAAHHAPAATRKVRTPRAAAGRTETEASAPLPRMLGQMMVTRLSGTIPSPSLLARIRSGQVGGVILFSDNLAGGTAEIRALTEQLQAAANDGGNPPLLIMTDQEGGEVRRLAGPPSLAPAEMTSSSVAFTEGRATGLLLRRLGINLDLAPVADVERIAGSFLGTRSFGDEPALAGPRACAFASGLSAAGVAYTLKHFPGLGRATASTDIVPVVVPAPAATLRADYAAYNRCGSGPLAVVMISSAIYPKLTGPLPAVMSPLTYRRELPLATGGASVVTISDDLQAGALADQTAPARQAIDAGLDLLMYAGTEQASAEAYTILLADAESGRLSKARIRAAYDAIVALKRRVARPVNEDPNQRAGRGLPAHGSSS